MMRGLGAAIGSALLWVAAMTSPAMAAPRVLSFEELDGWEQDNHAAAFATFLETCADIRDPEWAGLCAFARNEKASPRAFFELFFRPVLIGGESRALFTGYYEPELRGSLTRGGPYRFPIYRKPPDVVDGVQWYSRAEIEAGGRLSGRGLEIAWIDDPVDVFFLQIQGSGRVRLQDGRVIRVGYAGRNGHAYQSVGHELIRRGIFEPHQVSADVIKNWVRANPGIGMQLLQHNPSYVFFRVLSGLPAERGPLGAMNRSITAGRSIAVDPSFTPLGAPVWIEKSGESPIRRLMIAQDTGGAIKGAQRADIFYGTGEAAGKEAGRIRDPGRMVVLMPIQRAYALASEG